MNYENDAVCESHRQLVNPQKGVFIGEIQEKDVESVSDETDDN